jgi:hypothetical protein
MQTKPTVDIERVLAYLRRCTSCPEEMSTILWVSDVFVEAQKSVEECGTNSPFARA